MALTSFRELFTSFAIIGILIFGTLSFIVISQQDNNSNSTILDNDVINKTFTKLETNLSGFRDTTQTQRGNFESEIPERGFGSLLIFSIVAVGQKVGALVVGVYNVIIVLPASILGVSDVVIGVMSSILLLTLVLLSWRVYRAGS